MSGFHLLTVGLLLVLCASSFGCASPGRGSFLAASGGGETAVPEPTVAQPRPISPHTQSAALTGPAFPEAVAPPMSPADVAPAAYVAPGTVPSPASQGYLQQGPGFAANVDPQGPRGLAEQILYLRRENQQFGDGIKHLKEQLSELRKDVDEARKSAERAERACASTERELATARRQFEDFHRQVQLALERMQAEEQNQLQELDDVVGMLQATLRKYKEAVHDETPNKPH
jgi:hypothetical protein